MLIGARESWFRPWDRAFKGPPLPSPLLQKEEREAAGQTLLEWIGALRDLWIVEGAWLFHVDKRFTCGADTTRVPINR